ncbi:hypothetical protein JHK82_018980 [Glycine max]|nr:hypothetical protein JHK85_019419 [Glycine max]KAG5143285.1 hypothetical protein JHK82_018980 [Glycine max]
MGSTGAKGLGLCLCLLRASVTHFLLTVASNRFFGSVPVHLCYLRQICLLDLSRNNLLEGIPTCLSNFTAMREMGVIRRKIVTRQRLTYGVMSSNVYDSNVLLMWKGQEYLYLNPEFLLKSIDLSSNDLTGEIPKEVRYLLELVSLNLSRNRLSGEILPEIGNLTSLELSRNHFSCEVPSTLSKIDRLAMLDLSNNYLVGRIPWGRQLQTFSASTFEGNTDLCGEPLNKSCPVNGTATKPQGPAIHDDDDNSVFCEALYMSLGLGFFTGFWGLIGCPGQYFQRIQILTFMVGLHISDEHVEWEDIHEQRALNVFLAVGDCVLVGFQVINFS